MSRKSYDPEAFEVDRPSTPITLETTIGHVLHDDTANTTFLEAAFAIIGKDAGDRLGPNAGELVYHVADVRLTVEADTR